MSNYPNPKAGTPPDLYEWSYLGLGLKLHARRKRDSVIDVVAVCGLDNWTSDWKGTGSQKEYDYVARAPKCKKCVKLLEEKG